MYLNIPSARKPVHRGPEIPVPSVPKDIAIAKDRDTELEDMDTSASYQPPIPDKNKPMSLSKAQLNDLTRDLGLLKESAQLHGTHLDKRNLLASGTVLLLIHAVENVLKA